AQPFEQLAQVRIRKEINLLLLEDDLWRFNQLSAQFGKGIRSAPQNGWSRGYCRGGLLLASCAHYAVRFPNGELGIVFGVRIHCGNNRNAVSRRKNPQFSHRLDDRLGSWDAERARR